MNASALNEASRSSIMSGLMVSLCYSFFTSSSQLARKEDTKACREGFWSPTTSQLLIVGKVCLTGEGEQAVLHGSECLQLPLGVCGSMRLKEGRLFHSYMKIAAARDLSCGLPAKCSS